MNDCSMQFQSGTWRRLAWLCILGATACAAAAAQPPRIDGTWVGSSVEDGLPFAVRLDVRGGASAPRLAMRLGAPHHCGIEASRSEMFPDEFAYEVAPPSGGGRCDDFYPDTLTLFPGEGARLTLHAGTGGHGSTFELRRPGSPRDPDAADPTALLGIWIGALPLDDVSRVGVRLEVTGVEPGDDHNTLRYASPRQCSVALAYEGALGPVHYFSIPASPGGYCDRIVGRHLWARIRENRFVYGFLPGNSDCRDECVLDPARR